MSKLGPITNGVIRIGKSNLRMYATFGEHVKEIARSMSGYPDEQRKANAALYADAHNTANRTGKLPSELEAERDELLTLLLESQFDIGGDWRKRRDALIAKSTGK